MNFQEKKTQKRRFHLISSMGKTKNLSFYHWYPNRLEKKTYTISCSIRSVQPYHLSAMDLLAGSKHIQKTMHLESER